ncbi:hypothetical protein H8356DRAFT_1029762 [Neocallimastix lanati (nom. inval.)]|uniref:Uncharacterized protein n=1 Tax=Neocallimastix californiae TaxID=1754190 RepID=A0A1Y2B2T2_9FUNG|nr:hypothetical protein H8356DRAFT_1029762 [Neocallimastix sp. JGI-2020a]ORY29044.1 hypothetical protein LY90DRAFT_673998 [Neocallimastix californiae]|eukprot:ORY29044.1 hypothetical protein LY90DRAFT_673998 [Neocallimastix californiae]
MAKNSTPFWCCVSGMMFGTAWWLFIDTYIWDINKNEDNGDMQSIVSYIPGILGTVGFLFVNIIPKSTLSSDEYGKEISSFKRFVMLIAFSVTFSSLISSFWIFFAKYVSENYTLWVGFVILIQSVLLFISTYLFRFTRSTEEYPQYYY